MDDTMEMEIQRERQPAGNLSESVFKKAVFDRDKTVNSAPSVFERKTVFNIGERPGQNGPSR